MIELKGFEFPEHARFLLVSCNPDTNSGEQKHNKDGVPMWRLDCLVSIPESRPENFTVKIASNKDLSLLPDMTPFEGFTELSAITYDIGAGKNNGISLRAKGIRNSK